MGGRGSSSGMSGGGGGSAGGSASISRTIERASFTNEGGGNYQLDIPGVGGGQVLDETGGSRDLMYGRGGKVYSARAWDSNYNMIGTDMYFSSLNEAKRAIKDELRNAYGLRG